MSAPGDEGHGSSVAGADRRGPVGAALRRTAFFAALWWVLVGGSPTGWLFGLLAVPGATAASLRLGPATPIRLRPWPLFRYAARFLAESLRSGFDVARRALDPALPLAPAFVEIPLRLEDETSRVLLAGTVTMLPGTITAEIEGDHLVVHAIDARTPVTVRVRAMEERIGHVFGAGFARATDGGPDRSRGGG